MNVFQQSAQALSGAQNRTRAVMNNMNNLGFTAAQAGNAPTAQAASMGQAPQLGGMNLSGYMNPYTQNVIDSTMGQMDRQRQQMLGQVGAQATAAGAFGGSRHGLVEAETNRGFADSMGQMAAGLNQSNFQNAQQMGQFDIGNRMNAGQFNAGLQQQTNMQNANNQMQNNQFNAGQQNQVGGQNQQAELAARQMRLNAAGQMGQLSNMGFGMGQQINGMQSQAGQQQQQINQQQIDAIRAQYGGYQQAPQQGLAGQIGAVSGTPVAQSQTQTSNPGLLGLLAGGASLAGGLGWAPF
ncbi:MAG: hypothetical protein ACK4NW_01985 [Roseinatronobacter sp.]